MRSSEIVIRSAYFGTQKRRKYAKNVGISRSARLMQSGTYFLFGNGARGLLIWKFYWCKTTTKMGIFKSVSFLNFISLFII